ncbi:hypothetical protein [Nonomuraea rosea]
MNAADADSALPTGPYIRVYGTASPAMAVPLSGKPAKCPVADLAGCASWTDNYQKLFAVKSTALAIRGKLDERSKMSLIRKSIVGGVATALLLTMGAASPALATSTRLGSVCVRAASSPQEVCVQATPGFIRLAATISSAANRSSYAVRLQPAEGISVNCIVPGGMANYPQGFRISGIQVFSTSTCVG